MEVKFYLEKPTARGESFIFYSFHVFGFRARRSTKLKVRPDHWNLRYWRVKPSHPNADIINHYLNNLAYRSKEAKLYFISNFKVPSPEEFLDKVFTIDKTPTENIFERYKEFMEYKSKTITQESLNAYITAGNFLREFDPHLTNFSGKKIDKFQDWLLAKKFSPNYIVKMVGHVVLFCKWAGLPYELTNKVTNRKADTIALDLEEIMKIVNCEIENKAVERIRDLFVFQCFTGLRHSDLAEFKPSFVQKIGDVKCLVFYSKKTGSKSVIPLFKEAQRILNKYSGDLPRRISLSKYNRYLREICRMSGITDLVQTTKLEGNKKLRFSIEKYKLISSHSSRRGFVSIMSSLGLTAKEISLMTGHSQQRIVDIYDKTKADANAVKVFEILKGRV